MNDLKGLGCLFSCAVLLTGCGKVASSPSPPRVAESARFPETPSTLVAPVSINLAALREQLEGQVDRRLVSFSENREDCTPDQYAKTCLVPRIRRDGWKLKKDGCSKWVSTKVMDGIDCHIDAHADRGDISVTASGNVITVSVPVSASATVRGRGELINKLQETVSGSIVATAAITADIDSQWNPVVTVTPDFSWKERANLKVLGFEITVGSHLEPEIEKVMGKLQTEVDKAIQQFAFRRRAEGLWSASHTLIKVGSNPDVWFQFTPREVRFSGISSTPGSIEMTLMASGVTQAFAGAQPPVAAVSPLPPLVKALPADGFNLYLPIFVDYAALEAAFAKALKFGERQQFELPKVGDVGVIFRAVRVYPTLGNALAIGITLEADPPRQFFDTQGEIWIKARLDVDSENLRISPADLDYGADTDNVATNLLVSIARQPLVRKELESALAYDFAKEYEWALKEANAALNRDLGSGFILEGVISEAGAEEIKPTPNGVYMGMYVSGKLGIRLPSAKASSL